MRTLPVDLPACAAPSECVVVLDCQRLQSVKNDFLRHRFDIAVAGDASNERADTCGKVEASDDVSDLRHRVRGANEVPVSNPPVEQEAPVPGEDDAVFGDGSVNYLGVGIVVPVKGVEAEESEESGEFAQVDIEYESGGT